MLRITKLTDYGMVLLIEMAKQPEMTHNPARLAEDLHIPEPTVAKLLKRMTAGGLLRSRRGKDGGYQLERDPEEITLARVLNVLEGPLAVTECSAGPGLCQLESNCSVRDNWQQINRAIYQGLDQLSLAAMSRPRGAEALTWQLN